ncbi:MAG: sugar ABC transporter substrate-binding protein, partial [Burkholderiales bacterium]
GRQCRPFLSAITHRASRISHHGSEMARGTPVIAVFTKNRTNPAYAAARLGADRVAARLGTRIAHYVPDQPDDVAEQKVLVEHAIAGRPDAAVFVPVHATAMSDSVRKLEAAGIPIVNYLNRLAEGRFVTYVGSDDYQLAHDIAAYLFRHIGATGDVAILEGVPAAVTSQERLRGFRDAARDSPGIHVVASRAADYQQVTARRVTAELLARLPRVDGILCANDVMALGAIEALDAAGRRIALVGVNALPEAIAAIKKGKLLATADFDAMAISSIATEAAIRHLRGERIPAQIILPVRIVDAANYEAWDRPFEERESPRWEDVVKG